jgi:arylsulfatase A-like enzyme
MILNKHILLLLAIIGLIITSSACDVKVKSKSPNIILIMGDDIGFSDLGCYGSEIQTPNLDKLAGQGIRFRSFYNASKCNPTRSSLLTGLYQGNEKAVNIAQVLSNAGYNTLYSGKEHFDKWVPKHCLAKNSFDHSFYFRVTNEFHIPPDSVFQHPFCLGDKQLEVKDIEVQKQPFFKTDVVTDYAIKFLSKAKEDDNPFFLYMPYHVAHYPLQARPEDIAKYKGKYKVGWDVIRKRRFEKMKQIGIAEEDWQLSEPTDNINKFRNKKKKGDLDKRALIPNYRPWNELSEIEKEELDLEMAVFAAMIDRMDQNIGRLIQWLKDEGEYENTIIMYLSDNGSCPYDSNRDFKFPPGPAESYRTLSAAWANVGNTPFRYFKQYGHEGGCNTQFIVHYPDMIKKGFVTNQTGHIVDILPTLIDVAKTKYPEKLGDIEPLPLHGKSLLPIFEGKQRVEPDFFMSGYTDNFRMYRKGDWKLVKANGEEWELYNLKSDRTEMNNLVDSLPSKVEELVKSYEKESENLFNISNEN